MKKLRKVIAMFVVMIMAASLMPQMVIAAETNDTYMYGWYRNDDATTDNKKSYIVRNDAVSGKNSLYIQKNDGAWADYSVDQNVLIPEGTYTLSFWVKGDYEDNTAILLEGSHWQTHKFSNKEHTTGTEFTVTERADGWEKFEKTLTVNNTNSKFRILTVGWANGFYIDDIRLVKEGTSKNLIKNGDFERPTTPETGDDAYLYGWDRSNKATDNDNAKSLVATNYAVSGSNSLYIQHNDSSQTWSMISVAQNVEIPAGSYTLSFWLAGDYDGGKCTILFEGNHWQTHKFDSSEPAGNPYIVTERADGWKKFEKTVTINNTNGRILIVSDGNTTGFYIDDISLVNNATNQDLIKNGSFDELKPVVHEHTWEGVITTQPTVNVEGVKTFTCTVCGEQKTEVIEQIAAQKADDAYLYGWDRSNKATDNENVKSYIVGNNAVSGSNSLYIQHNDSSQTWKMVSVAQSVEIPAGSYTLSFWLAGDYDGGKCTILFEGNHWQTHKFDSSEPAGNPYIVTERADGWKKFEKTVTINDTNGRILIVSDGNTAGFYIDDMSLVNNATNQDLIKNGSFDEKAREEYTTSYENKLKGWFREDKFDTDKVTAYSCVAGDVSHSGEHSIHLRHTDTNNTWNFVSVSQNINIGEGTYKLSFWATGEYPISGINSVILFGTWVAHEFTTFTAVETDGEWKKYEKEITVETGKSHNKISLVTNGNTNMYIDDVSLVKAGTTNNIISNGDFEYDVTASYTDDYSDYLVNWIKRSGFEPDGKLTFTCVTNKISHSGNNSVVIRHADTSKNWNALFLDQDITMGEGTYTLSFWSAGDYPVTNLNCVIFDGGKWESHNLDTFAAVESHGIWTRYEKTITVPAGITQNLMRFASNGATNAWYIDDISLVKEGTTENLVKNGSFESKGYKIFEPEIVKLDGDTEVELTEIEAGTLKVKAKIENYAMGEDFKPIMIVALYDGQRLNKIVSVQQVVNETAMESNIADELCVTIQVPEITEDTNYKLKVMIWNSWDTLEPLCGVLELN